MFQIRVSSPSTVAFAIGRIQFNRMPKTRFSAIQSKTEIPTSEPNPGQTKLQFPHILSLLPSIAFIVYLLILVLVIPISFLFVLMLDSFICENFRFWRFQRWFSSRASCFYEEKEIKKDRSSKNTSWSKTSCPKSENFYSLIAPCIITLSGYMDSFILESVNCLYHWFVTWKLKLAGTLILILYGYIYVQYIQFSHSTSSFPHFLPSLPLTLGFNFFTHLITILFWLWYSASRKGVSLYSNEV